MMICAVSTRTTMSRWAKRIDGTHPRFVEFFCAHGCQVESLASVGRGIPDLLVGWNHAIALVEVKTARGQVRKAQQRFREKFPATWIVRSEDDCLKVVKALKASSLERASDPIQHPVKIRPGMDRIVSRPP